MKTKLILFMMAFLIVFPGVSCGEELVEWSSPWKKDKNINLYSLLKDGYTIIGLDFASSLDGVVEVVYLKKYGEICRCLTVFSSRTTGHNCEKLIKPEKYADIEMKKRDADALADLKNAFTSSQAFFCDNPTGTVDLPMLRHNDLRISEDVEIQVLDGKIDNLKIRSKHKLGSKVYEVDASGKISTVNR